MRHALQPHPILALLLTTSSVIGLCCGSSGCSKPLVRISTPGGNIDVSIPSSFGTQPAAAEKSAPRGAPSASGPAAAAPAAAVTSSIIGVEYPLDRWSPEEIEARLRRNQMEFDQLVGSRTELTGTHPDPVWERAVGVDAADFFTSDELFALHRLDLELTQLWGILGAHHARAQLLKRVEDLERDVERMQRDGVDARAQARGRAKLKDELRPQLERANKVMLAGSMGKPPLGTAQASSVPLAFGSVARSGSETGLVDLRDLRSVRSLDQNFALDAVRGLIMWPSVTGNIIRLGDSHQKPEVRRRVLATQAAAAAAMYSERLASARSEQQANFRDCMEFCKQIEALARAGDDRGVDAARQSRVQAALGRLLEPMTAEPSAGKKAEQVVQRGAATPAQGAGSAAKGAGSAANGAGSAANGAGFQDFKGGVAEVIDLDSLSPPFLQARLEAARKRYGEYAATQPLTVDAAREMRSMLAHATLAGNLLRSVRSREMEKANLARLQQEARTEAELGISTEQQRDRVRRLEEMLAEKRYAVVSVTCNGYARQAAKWVAWADAFGEGDWIRGSTEPLLQIWGIEISSCLPGAHPSAGTRSMNALVRSLQEEAKRSYGAEPEISKWLVEESRFYEKLAKDIDALRSLRSTGETTQYRDAARRIDDALRTRRNSTFAGFFDPLPDAAGPK